MTTSTSKMGGDTAAAAEVSANQREVTVGGARTATLNLPFVTATFRVPDVRLPQVRIPKRQEVSAAAQVVQSQLPSPRKLAYFSGLAALAAFELIEWPVALAIGAGTAIVGRSESDEPQRRTPELTAGKTATSAAPAKGSARAKPTRAKAATPAKGAAKTPARLEAGSEESQERPAGLPPSS